VTPQDLPQLREWDGRIDALARTGSLALRSVRADTVLVGRAHERYDQFVGGVRVFGGDLSRQTRSGVTESIFGTIYNSIDVNTVPTISADQARVAFANLQGTEFPVERAVELVILPRYEGGYALAWRTHVLSEQGWMNTFIDAQSGALLLQVDDRQTQSAVGTGTGVLGDKKKISTLASAGAYFADDQLRPPQLTTFDARGNLTRAKLWLYYGLTPSLSDVASDADNNWTDGANVDAHVYLGWTYDYYFKRFDRKGLDDGDGPVRAITHPVRRSDIFSARLADLDFYLNAFWCSGCGPGGRGMIAFGEGLPEGYVLTGTGQSVNYFAGSLDIVAHELTHAVTDYSSRLEYERESGALNESFSDIMGTSAEFFFEPPGSGLRHADYLIGEDTFTPGGIRSMSDPAAFGQPDHYSRRFRGSSDNGGVHTNSGIPNHAFYLAIEGGVNRTSGISVQGVGAANREQVEKVFYRAFVHMLTSNASFSTARSATIQSARDLYGAGSPAERAITEAWTAVGVF